MADIGNRTYLLHFERPIGRKQSDQARDRYGLGKRKSKTWKPTAQHYMGSTDDLARRIEQHRNGRTSAARFTQAAKREGILFRVVRVLRGGTAVEYALKRRKNSKALCPVCNTGAKMTDKDLTRAEINDELVPF